MFHNPPSNNNNNNNRNNCLLSWLIKSAYCTLIYIKLDPPTVYNLMYPPNDFFKPALPFTIKTLISKIKKPYFYI